MIKYFGGKSWLGKKISNLCIPKREGFIDVFTGGGSMTDWAFPRFDNLVINDIDDLLINFYIVCRDEPEKLIDYLEDIKKDDLGIKHKDLIEIAKGDYDNITKAAYYYFGNQVCYGGIPYDSPIQSKIQIFNNTPQKKNIMKVNRILKKCEINNLDYRDLLDKYKDKNYFYYYDAPYFDVAANNYYGINGENHKGFNHYELADYVKDLDKKGKVFMMSYEYSDVIKEMYSGFNQFKIPKVTVVASDDHHSVKDTPEILITNFEIKQTRKQSLL